MKIILQWNRVHNSFHFLNLTCFRVKRDIQWERKRRSGLDFIQDNWWLLDVEPCLYLTGVSWKVVSELLHLHETCEDNHWHYDQECGESKQWFHVDRNENRLRYAHVLDRLHKISHIWAYRCSRPMWSSDESFTVQRWPVIRILICCRGMCHSLSMPGRLH